MIAQVLSTAFLSGAHPIGFDTRVSNEKRPPGTILGLLFHRYNGNEHYLYQVWMPDRSEFSELNPTRRDSRRCLQRNQLRLPGTL
jgi:hypothetical protein